VHHLGSKFVYDGPPCIRERPFEVPFEDTEGAFVLVGGSRRDLVPLPLPENVSWTVSNSAGVTSDSCAPGKMVPCDGCARATQEQQRMAYGVSNKETARSAAEAPDVRQDPRACSEAV